jgi:hypothetical protein
MKKGEVIRLFLFVKNKLKFLSFLCYNYQTFSFFFINELKNSEDGS